MHRLEVAVFRGGHERCIGRPGPAAFPAVREQQLEGAAGAWNAGSGEHGQIIDWGASIKKKPHFV
jgi:hypothetical protein